MNIILGGMIMNCPNLKSKNWHQAMGNPLVNRLRDIDSAGDAYGDPQIILPGCHDDMWHMFFHGFVTENGRGEQYFHHMISTDGISWKLHKRWASYMGQSFILKEKDVYFFYSSCYDHSATNLKPVSIKLFVTKDFENFSEPIPLLEPEFEWELEGEYKQVRNPCVIRLPNGKYRMYYCGGVVVLPDLGYEEPKYVSIAESESPMGPFIKYGKPILSPDIAIPHRTLGSGAMKVFGYEGGYLALYNGIHRDSFGRSTSSISVLYSDDGIMWQEADYNPIICADTGWRKAIVYQLDLVEWRKQLRIYYNARDEWRDGVEKIGMSWMNYAGPSILRLNGL